MSSSLLVLILGGANSGKSAFAEALVLNQPGRPLYLATAQALDSEMRTRIDRHRAQRGQNWDTVEAPLDIEAAIAEQEPDRPILLDCATLWLTNHLLLDSDLRQVSEDLVQTLGTASQPITVVSNEVGQGVVPDNAMARQFREAQGGLNQMLAARADLVVQIIAGLPNVLKGHLP